MCCANMVVALHALLLCREVTKRERTESGMEFHVFREMSTTQQFTSEIFVV
jgi:hypothetical protein